MLSAFGPVFIDGILNMADIGLVDGSFSNSQGEHDCSIAEKISGRQQKVNGIEKNLARELPGVENPPIWVEMKIRGLKIGRI